MQSETIQNKIEETFDKDLIEAIDIKINQYNEQIDELTITLKDSEAFDFTHLGILLSWIELYTMEDEYGDLVEFEVKWSYQSDDKGTLRAVLNITFGIDS